MGETKIKRIMTSILSITMIIIINFIGLFIFDGITDNNCVEAVSIVVDCNGKGDYKTIQEAINSANHNDTIYVWAGEYNENLVIKKPITLIGNGSKKSIINGNRIKFTINISSDFVNISNFKIKKGLNSGIYLFKSNKCNISTNFCSNTNDDGIELWESEKNIIMNNNCSKNEENGILLYNSNGNFILNNTCENNQYNGIILYKSNDNKIDNNTCIFNCENIYLKLSNNNSLLRNNCSQGRDYGIYLDSGMKNRIKNNVCYKNCYGGIAFNTIIDEHITYSSSNNEIEMNICKYNGGSGIDCNDIKKSIIINNICSFNGGSGIGVNIDSYYNLIKNNSCLNNYVGLNMGHYNSDNIIEFNNFSNNIYGCRLIDSDLNKIINNEFFNCFYGLKSYNCRYLTIYNNIFNNSGIIFEGVSLEYWNTHNIGKNNSINNLPIIYLKDVNNVCIQENGGQIILANCQNIIIENKTLTKSTIALQIGFSNYNSIKNNNFSENNEIGIYLVNSNFNQISNNKCNLNFQGIIIQSSDYNNVSFNSIENNTDWGLGFSNNFHLGDSSYNLIHHNVFLNNNNGSIQAYDDGDNNKWNTSNRGNYWSDYSGLDNGVNNRIANDGVGDTEIPHLGLDYYPLMKPFKPLNKTWMNETLMNITWTSIQTNNFSEYMRINSHIAFNVINQVRKFNF
jgi:parallel beta-helix repeat protein